MSPSRRRPRSPSVPCRRACWAAGAKLASKPTSRQLSSGAVAVNGAKVTALDAVIGDSDRRFGRYTVLQRGKKNHCLIVWG